MSHPWFSLVKALLNVNFGVSALKFQVRSKKRRLWEPLLIGLALVVAGVSVVSLVVFFAESYVKLGLMVGQPELILTLAHLVAAVTVFVFGIAFVMSSMYFANDMAQLMSWPLKTRQIVSAKITTVLVNEYMTMALILIPVYVVYARHVPVSGWYYPAALITFLFTPMIPLMLATLVTMLLMRLVGGRRRRDLLTMVGGILGIAVYLGITYFFQAQFPQGATDAELAAMLFERLHGISEALAGGYPPSLWGMQSLDLAGTTAGWLALLKLVGVGVLLYGAMLAIGERLFARAVQEGRESAGKRQPKGELTWSEGSAIDAVARVERKMIFRTPVYALNGLVLFVLFPFLLLAPSATNMQDLTVLLEQFAIDPLFGALILAGWFGLAAATSPILPTAFSREGAYQLWIMKSLPISGREFFLGKLKGGLSILLIGSLPGAAVLIYLLKLQAVPVLLGLLLGVGLATFISLIGLGIDMMRPMLNWTDPARAMKANMNVMILLLAVAALIGVLFLLVRLLLGWGVGIQGMLLVAFILFGVGSLVLWKLLQPRLEMWLMRMGD